MQAQHFARFQMQAFFALLVKKQILLYKPLGLVGVIMTSYNMIVVCLSVRLVHHMESEEFMTKVYMYVCVLRNIRGMMEPPPELNEAVSRSCNDLFDDMAKIITCF